MATRKQTPPKRRGATSSRRQTPRKPRREWRLPGWVWGLAGLVGGFLLSQHQHGVAPWQVEDSPLATVLPRSAPPEPEAAAPARPSEPRMPTFEFYTLLPESEVIAPRGEMPASTARPPAPPPAEESSEAASAQESADPIAEVIAANLATERSEPTAAAEPAGNGHRYMLQAASFRESGDAQQLQRRLRDFGLLAQVSEVRAGGGETWHRVQVGPYDDNRELSRAQDLMVTQGIEPLLIRLQN
ncbi:SPOR domain-containing protein [Halomonas mongoliensis]|jgi:cell division septation protein DedD|uniref:SPOR domain-containing protein n=1 Tax=Halomonas mongoliensis TaxID=321265 RepID=A0ABU1GJG3_9GAMM|nr:SPOR domain-containing protein [Halomonas mongoliensis]MDR5892151.1 SPOR domain-containing protein [Halomonas mongoliensis]